MLGLMQLGGALRNWMPAKTQKTARSVRIGQQPAAGGAAGLLLDFAVGQRQ
tara:strand:- start:143 stop:295 length:153 start_codon:yes stop_codon:yes gene_type:complete